MTKNASLSSPMNIDPEELLQQIRAYEDADELLLNKVYKGLLTTYRTHPFPILRAQDLDTWHRDDYRCLMGPTELLEA